MIHCVFCTNRTRAPVGGAQCNTWTVVSPVIWHQHAVKSEKDVIPLHSVRLRLSFKVDALPRPLFQHSNTTLLPLLANSLAISLTHFCHTKIFASNDYRATLSTIVVANPKNYCERTKHEFQDFLQFIALFLQRDCQSDLRKPVERRVLKLGELFSRSWGTESENGSSLRVNGKG